MSEPVSNDSPCRSHWNYRLVRLNEEDVEICEVYYNEDDAPTGYVRRSAGGATREEIKVSLHHMFEALNKSVLATRVLEDDSVELFDTRQLL